MLHTNSSMETSGTLQTTDNLRWSFLQKMLFRFFFIFLVFQMIDWWLAIIPAADFVGRYYGELMDWMVQLANKKIFHIREVLVYPAGSGDTSFGWVYLYVTLCLTLLGSLIWTIADSKRNNYQRLNYWLCLFVRYFIAIVAYSYGISKLFALQMPFPNTSQLATPLGDFLPMRLSWMFIGYSTPYQVFSGLMEVMVSLLLINRRTATLGALLGTAVFLNVAALNLSYDIPVKIFSLSMVVVCLYLLANEWRRIWCFFILNKPAAACTIYHFSFGKKWMRITRLVLKTAFIILAFILPFYNDWQQWKSIAHTPESKPIKSGMYDVVTFAINKDTLPPLLTDSMRWQNVVFEKNGSGSVKTADTTFRQRYRRGYFSSKVDTAKQLITFKKLPADSAMYDGIFMTMHYQLADSNTIQLWGKEHNDSLYVLLKRSNRHFQLADRPFHWLSEYNR